MESAGIDDPELGGAVMHGVETPQQRPFMPQPVRPIQREFRPDDPERTCAAIGQPRGQMPGAGSSINCVSPMIPPNSKSSCDVPLLESVWRILASVWPSGLVHSRSCGIQLSRKNNVTIRTTCAMLKYNTGRPCVNPYAIVAMHRIISLGQAMPEMKYLVLDSLSEMSRFFYAHPTGFTIGFVDRGNCSSIFRSFKAKIPENVEHRRRRFKRITLLNPGRRALK